MNSNENDENDENDEKMITLNRTAIPPINIDFKKLIIIYQKHGTDCNCGFKYCHTGGRELLIKPKDK